MLTKKGNILVMVDLTIYKNYFPNYSITDWVKEFQKSIIITNRTADFFVNWEKVRENAESLRIELSLMNSLIGCARAYGLQTVMYGKDQKANLPKLSIIWIMFSI